MAIVSKHVVFAIIGGSGLQSLSSLRSTMEHGQETPYGRTSTVVSSGLIGDKTAYFLPRHGVNHTIPPHLINYQANLWALKELGVEKIVSVASVGGIQERFRPGLLVVPHQIIDYTWGRQCTYSGDSAPVKHVDFTHPFSKTLRIDLLAAADRCDQDLIDGGVYAATQGPRLESAAEIDRIERDGGNLVGMTGMPEAALARELDLEYAIVAVVVNRAAGRGESRNGIPLSEITAVSIDAMVKVESILVDLIST